MKGEPSSIPCGSLMRDAGSDQLEEHGVMSFCPVRTTKEDSWL